MSEITLESLQTRLVGCELAIQALQKQVKSGGGQPTATGGSPTSELLKDEFLDRDWADKTIRRDPPKWTGETRVGSTMSECDPKYLDDHAGFLEWKVSKDKELPEPKKDAQGKPYWMKDEFEAKLARTWAARHRRVAAAVTAAPAGDDQLPF